MAITRSNESTSARKSFFGRFTTFVEALETDIHDYQEQRIADLEQRLARLEAAATASLPIPVPVREV